MESYHPYQFTTHKNEHKMISHANFSNILGAVINAKLASLKDMQEFYSMSDAYDLYEIITVDSYNARLLSQ